MGTEQRNSEQRKGSDKENRRNGTIVIREPVIVPQRERVQEVPGKGKRIDTEDPKKISTCPKVQHGASRGETSKKKNKKSSNQTKVAAGGEVMVQVQQAEKQSGVHTKGLARPIAQSNAIEKGEHSRQRQEDEIL